MKTNYLLATLFLLASHLPAEVVIKHFDFPLPDRELPRPHVINDLPPAISDSIPLNKSETTTSVYFLPAFKIDATSPTGETTTVAVRNEHSESNAVTILLYEPYSLDPSVEIMSALLPKEVWTLNLRSKTEILQPDPDGFIRGWGLIVADGLEMISADFFQIDSSQDFSVGGRPPALENTFCKNITLRFLLEGSFTGGTIINFLVDQPLGEDPNDPPSITGTVYHENGTIDGTFEVFTHDYSLEVDASILTNSANFGSMDISFPSGSGGFAMAQYKADNRHSVSIQGICLDPPTP